MSAVRKIGTVTLRGVTYDLAMNSVACLGLEEKDLYDLPRTRAVAWEEPMRDGKIQLLLQELLDALATAMKERDAALASLQKGS